MTAEVVKAGKSYAVELVIGVERFRIKYFSPYRVDPLEDARKYAERIGKAILAQSKSVEKEKI